MLFPGLTLVISPLISLMKDQVGALVEAGVPAACINSAMSAEEFATRCTSPDEGNTSCCMLRRNA